MNKNKIAMAVALLFLSAGNAVADLDNNMINGFYDDTGPWSNDGDIADPISNIVYWGGWCCR